MMTLLQMKNTPMYDYFTHYVKAIHASRLNIEGIGLQSCATQGKKYLFEACISGVRRGNNYHE
jgi:hypothetical protein